MHKKIVRFALISLLMLIITLSGSSRLLTGQASTAPETPLTLLPIATSDKTHVLRIYYSIQSEIDTLSHSLDIWEVNRSAGYFVAAVSPAEMDWLKIAGYRFEVDEGKSSLLQAPEAPLDPRFYYFDDDFFNANGRYVVNFLQETESTFPNITELVDIGDAWQASHGGHLRDMWVLRITNEDPAYGDILEKPAFFLMAEIHAREVATPELAIRYIKYLTSGFESQGGYGLDPDVTWMVNHHVVYVLVMQNPDGHRVDEADTSAYWRKNLNNDACSTGNFGIDLNRNHSFLWGCCGGSSSNPCAEDYRGATEASEPETQAFQEYIMTVIPDQNGPNDNWTIAPSSPITTTGFFISLHSYADDILWPWFLPGYPSAPNQDQMKDIGRKMASINNYYPAGTIGYTVDGSANYWTYGKLGIPAYTFEVGPNSGSCGGFFPAYGCIDGIDGMPRDFWVENRPVFIYATKIARQPYFNAFGPETRNMAVTPASVAPGEPISLTAQIFDVRYQSDPLTPVTGAEYFIDSPGIDGTGFSMSPADGSWGGTTENVSAVIDTCSLSTGQHYILVHGKNSNGFWGPFTAVFLDISGEMIPPLAEFTSNSPVFLGEPITFTNQTTGCNEIAYSWDFGDGIGSSVEISPTYVYTASGTYTVTLVATNNAGSGTAIHPATVESVVITGIELAQLTPDPLFAGDLVAFSADLQPDTAASPYTYTIDFGDGTLVSDLVSEIEPIQFNHTYNTGSAYTIRFSVNNAYMSESLTDFLDIMVNYRLFLPISLWR